MHACAIQNVVYHVHMCITQHGAQVKKQEARSKTYVLNVIQQKITVDHRRLKYTKVRPLWLCHQSPQVNKNLKIPTYYLFLQRKLQHVELVQAKKQAGIPSDDSLRANNISQILSSFASHMFKF